MPDIRWPRSLVTSSEPRRCKCSFPQPSEAGAWVGDTSDRPTIDRPQASWATPDAATAAGTRSSETGWEARGEPQEAKRRRARILVRAVLAAVVLMACAAEPAGQGSRLVWGECPPETLVPPGTGLQCASLEVPLDYAKPTNRQITIMISRLPATDPARRRGVLLLNPGGPGGPGVPFPLHFTDEMFAPVREQYDLIGFDTRGLLSSTPISCELNAEQLRYAPLAPPIPGEPFSATAELNRSIADSCARHGGDLLPTMYTANNARDMESIRIALGEARISYYGISYGTYLGAVYATMFPNHTDRVILDSSLHPASSWRDRIRAFGPAAELRFPDLTSFVAARHATYHLGATSHEVSGVYFRLLEELQAQPMTIGPNTVDGTVLRQITYQSLFEDRLLPIVAPVWQFLAQALGAPSEAEAEQLLTQLLTAVPLVPELQQIILPTALAVFCQDTAWPRSVETYQQSQELDSVLFPVAGPMSGNIWPCAFWRYPPQEPPVLITDRGPRNILMLQNLRDPATPATGARVMKDALGLRAAMVAVDQGGHGVYGAFNRCGNEAATAWLTQGSLPPHDVLCPAEQPEN